MQSDLAALSLEAVASSAATSVGRRRRARSQGLVVGQQLLAQLRETKPVGRLVIDVEGVLKGQPGGPDDVLVRDGDKLYRAEEDAGDHDIGRGAEPDLTCVRGRVSPRTITLRRAAGPLRRRIKKRIYVVRANGDVVAGGRTGWFRRSQTFEMRPGDTIVVPLDTERVRALPLWQAVTTIMYNLSIAILAIHSL